MPFFVAGSIAAAQPISRAKIRCRYQVCPPRRTARPVERRHQYRRDQRPGQQNRCNNHPSSEDPASGREGEQRKGEIPLLLDRQRPEVAKWGWGDELLDIRLASRDQVPVREPIHRSHHLDLDVATPADDRRPQHHAHEKGE